MPIPHDSEKVSIEFSYESDDSPKRLYQLKFFHNENGPVVHIFDGQFEPFELPANMFAEVADFLIRKGAVKGLSHAVSTPTSVPIPTLGRRPKVSGVPMKPLLETRRPVAGFQSNSEPVESLVLREDSQEDVGSSQIAAASAEAKVPDITPEEAQKILQARLAAKAKANVTGKTVRSNPKFETSPK